MRRLLLHRMPALNNIARLPWIKGNIRKLEKGGSLWEPSRLFDNGEEGAWFDPSDLSTMFQDSAGTTPVTANGQPVGKILDKSGRGNHASQATAAARPLYKVTGLCKWNDFDAVDDVLNTTFQSSLGSNCTVARGNVGAAPTILTGQTIGTSYANSVDNAGLIIVNRALTGQETIDLTAWLTAKGATS